jgi:hypothetical protein
MTSEWKLDETRYFLTESVWRSVPRSLRSRFRVEGSEDFDIEAGVVPCLFASASELFGERDRVIPDALATADARYAIIVDDVPVQELFGIPSHLNLHKPDLRAHLTPDAGIVRRALVSRLRDHPAEAILDAWLFDSDLCLLLADLGKRRVDLSRVRALGGVGRRETSRFEIDEDGSYLHWPEADVHLGVSQILQAVDPEFLSQVEIERNALDYTGWALERWRREAGIRQTDVEGLSERHVRRIEQGVSRLTSAAAERFAQAFGRTTGAFLDELARRSRRTREDVDRSPARMAGKAPGIVVLDWAA